MCLWIWFSSASVNRELGLVYEFFGIQPWNRKMLKPKAIIMHRRFPHSCLQRRYSRIVDMFRQDRSLYTIRLIYQMCVMGVQPIAATSHYIILEKLILWNNCNYWFYFNQLFARTRRDLSIPPNVENVINSFNWIFITQFLQFNWFNSIKLY